LVKVDVVDREPELTGVPAVSLKRYQTFGPSDDI
jgi:hypothetical protein